MSYIIVGHKHGPYPVAFAASFGDVAYSRRQALRLGTEANALRNRDDFQRAYPLLTWTVVPVPGGDK